MKHCKIVILHLSNMHVCIVHVWMDKTNIEQSDSIIRKVHSQNVLYQVTVNFM